MHGRGARGEGALFRLTPLIAALLLVYPGLQAHRAQAENVPASSQDTIPDLGQPSARTGNFSVRPNGATLDNRFDGKRLLISPEYSDQTGLSLGGAFAFPLGDSAAGGLLVTAGDKKNELLFNAGFQMDEIQRIVLTLGQLRQYLNIGFISGSEKTEMTQTSGAVSYQHYLGKGLLNSFEVNGYLADTPSRDLSDKTYATDTGIFNIDPRRVAGGRITGLQGKLVFTPTSNGTLKLGAGGEQLEYDYLTGKQSTTRATGSAEWSQQLMAGLNLKAGADAASAQNRFTVGLEGAYIEGWKLGVNLTGIRGRDGAPDDNQLQLTWSHDFGGKGVKTGATSGNAAPAWGSLLDQVAKRPIFLPAQVVAKLDTTAIPALPAGYVSQGGLIWMPVSATQYTYANATALCAGTINGQAGWRLPTTAELSALYASGAMNGQGWTLGNTWSSTPHGAGFHEDVGLVIGDVFQWLDATSLYVSCVR